MPAQQRQCRQGDEGNNPSATPAKTPAQCWRQHWCNKDDDTNKDTSAMRAKTPAQERQRCQCNKGKDTRKTIEKLQAGQWHIRSRMTPCIIFCEVSHQLLRFLKCPLSCPLITWDHHHPLLVHHVVVIHGSWRRHNRQRSGSWDWEGNQYTNRGGEYHGGKQLGQEEESKTKAEADVIAIQ